MEWQFVTLSMIRTASALCAVILAVLAYKAHRSTRRSALRWLAIASLILASGFLAAGVLYQTTESLLYATVLEAPFTLAALLFVLVSLFGRDLARGPRQPARPLK